MQGISNYALPIVLRVPSFELRNNLEKLMKLNKIEFREEMQVVEINLCNHI